ncbi:DNA cytosine methyltransferase [Sphingomonas faeni]|uniref:DNA cytosine methyltransferase n=1 Tax=Sphingomonas faeni TaxID=185950 RepID=UPI00334AFC81
MRYLDVCAGISASTVAWKPLGWEAAAYSEIEPAPRAVLEHRQGALPVGWDHRHIAGTNTTPLFGDFTQIEAHHVGPIDLLVGGTPCQDFSIAGLRAGLDGDRGNLSLEFLRLADRTRPRWVVWENVPGVLSINGGRAFGAILGGLGELGYGFAYAVLDAQHFGVPQRRRRVFVVGYLGDHRRAGAVLLERHSLSGHPAPRRETREGSAARLAPCLNAAFGSKLGLDNQHIDSGAGMFVTHSLRGEGFDASEDGTGRGTPLVPVCFETTQITSAANYSNPKPGDPCHPLAAGMHAPAIAFDCKASGQNGFGVGDVMSTLRSMGHANSHQNGGGHASVQYGSAVRRLTPRECERLQGFPDDYTLVPNRGKPMADGPRYKALGNSMAVPVMRWIGERIAAVDALQSPLTQLEQAA